MPSPAMPQDRALRRWRSVEPCRLGPCGLRSLTGDGAAFAPSADSAGYPHAGVTRRARLARVGVTALWSRRGVLQPAAPVLLFVSALWVQPASSGGTVGPLLPPTLAIPAGLRWF